jgi:SAM-dependent methyltransferase
MSAPTDFIDDLEPGDNGLWRPRHTSAVSYPDEGHDTCHAVEEASFWFAHRNRTLEAVLRQYPPAPGRPFLDVGGGNGFVAQMIAGLGHRVVLVEPGHAGADHAVGRGLTEVIEASIVDLRVQDGSVGGVGLFDVLEHIEDDAAALRRLREMLVEGGRLYLTVPAHRWLWSSVDPDSGHFRRYTRRSVSRLLRECGFDVTFASYYFWPLPLPMLLLRCLPERLHLRQPKDRAERAADEHGRSSRLMDAALDLERRRFARGRSMPFGASCVVAATKD